MYAGPPALSTQEEASADSETGRLTPGMSRVNVVSTIDYRHIDSNEAIDAGQTRT